MGKYMRKAQASGKVAFMEATQVGVRTRARTLAALQSAASSTTDSSSSYLQLRSRRLDKPPPPAADQKPMESPCAIPKSQRNASSKAAESTQSCEKVGDNVLEVETRSREAAAGSSIRDLETIGTPGSTTRPAASTVTNRRTQNSINRNILTACEMEEFFAGAERLQLRMFAEKYNFDPVNDLPLPGHYEWVRLDS